MISASCENYIMAFPQRIYESQDFCRCDRNVLKQMLRLDSMACSELDIFYACLKWSKYNCKLNGIDESKPANWRTQLGDCVELIRFGTFDTNQFRAHTASYGTEFFTPAEFMDIFIGKAQSSNQPRSIPTFKSISKAPQQDKVTVDSLRNSVENHPATVIFSTTCPVLLCHLLHRFALKAPNYGIEITVEIIEYGDQSFEAAVAKKKVFKESAFPLVEKKLNRTTNVYQIATKCQVVIDPQRMYEITWRTKNLSEKVVVPFGGTRSNHLKLGDQLTAIGSAP